VDFDNELFGKIFGGAFKSDVTVVSIVLGNLPVIFYTDARRLVFLANACSIEPAKQWTLMIGNFD
jgi:hypothetical protein